VKWRWAAKIRGGCGGRVLEEKEKRERTSPVFLKGKGGSIIQVGGSKRKNHKKLDLIDSKGRNRNTQPWDPHFGIFWGKWSLRGQKGKKKETWGCGPQKKEYVEHETIKRG